MNKLKILSCLMWLLILAPEIGFTQNVDLEQVDDQAKEKFNSLKKRWQKDPLKVSGAITAFSTFNHISGIDRRRDPFIWRLSANLNFDFMGITAPFSANYSSGNTLYSFRFPSYKLPSYQFVGISPTYKWITLHFGTRSMDFSDYTLANHSFSGVGIELKPGRFRFSAMRGRLRRAVAEDLNSLQNFEPVYKRKAWGFKIGYEHKKDNIALILFSAEDDEMSIPAINNFPNTTPMDNVILGLQGQKTFGKTFFRFDFGRSAYSRNKTAPTVSPVEEAGWLRRIGGLHTARISSGYDDAFTIGTGLNLNFGTLELNYERVGPAYRTLGALFFNNDFENFTIKLAGQFLDKKLSVQTNTGFQRNNLTGLKLQTNNRFVGSINTTYLPSQKWNFNASYSNFQTTSKLAAISIPFIQVDSIVLAQVSQQSNLSVTHTTGKQNNVIWMLMGGFYNSTSIIDDEIQENQKTVNYQSSLHFTYLFPASKWMISSALLGNLGSVPGSDILTISPSVTVGKSFFDKKLKLKAALAYLVVYLNGSDTNNILTSRMGLDYQVSKKQNLGLNFQLANRHRKGGINNSAGFTETNIRINYGYRF